MKTLKVFANGCYSETLIQESLEESKVAGPSAAIEPSNAEKDKEKDKEGAEADSSLIDALPPAPPYHAGLGARFKYPGDPRKLREKSKMKLWKDYLRGEPAAVSPSEYNSLMKLRATQCMVATSPWSDILNFYV